MVKSRNLCKCNGALPTYRIPLFIPTSIADASLNESSVKKAVPHPLDFQRTRFAKPFPGETRSRHRGSVDLASSAKFCKAPPDGTRIAFPSPHTPCTPAVI